jgi:hypothetical protein
MELMRYSHSMYRYFLGLATESPKWPIDAVKKELAALQLKDLVTFAEGLNGKAHGTALIQVHPRGSMCMAEWYSIGS